MGLTVSKDQAGVDALRKLSSSLSQELEKTNAACDKLKVTFDSVKETVAHENEIENILTHVAKINADTVTSIVSMTHRLNQIANKLEAFINGGLGGGNP